LTGLTGAQGSWGGRRWEGDLSRAGGGDGSEKREHEMGAKGRGRKLSQRVSLCN